jgi:myosin heavy subunit
VNVQKQIIYAPLPPDECKAARDSLAKELYDRLFNWLVLKLNQNIAP